MKAPNPRAPRYHRSGPPLAIFLVMKDVTLWLGIAVGLVLVSGLAAFFLYVPLMTVMSITTTLLALILMFALGITRRAAVREASDK